MKEEIISLTDRLVRFRSFRENPDDILRCADFIDDYFRDEDVYIRRFTKNNVPSLYVSLHETDSPTILLNAHFDVVPASESMFTPRRQDDLLIGRGVYDDKGPLAVFMVLMKELARTEDPPNVALVTEGDEEVGGHDGAAHVMEKDIDADFAIVADGGGLNEYSTKAKGIIRIDLKATGIDAHGSTPWRGKNAIELLMEVYRNIKDEFANDRVDHWEKSVTASIVKGGDAPNKVPRYAEMTLDIRFTEHDDADQILASIEQICDHVGNVEPEIIGVTPFFVTDEDNPYLRELLQVSKQVIGEEPTLTADHGGSNARFFANAGIPTVLTTPKGGNHHSNEEYLDTSRIDDFYYVIKNFVLTTD